MALLAARHPINLICPGIVRTPMTGRRRPISTAGLADGRTDADAVLVAAHSEETGQAWVCQPGREQLPFKFPNVPGPRVEGAEGMVPQL
jgi:hypothetical protein